MATEFEEGVLVGLLVGEGHFGGDGRQPQVTLRMHVRHEAMFRWLERTFPGGRVFGPYDHGGRRYYQWMARGRYLAEELLPLLERRLDSGIDGYAHGRLAEMHLRYAGKLGPLPPGEGSSTPAPSVDEVFDRLRGAPRTDAEEPHEGTAGDRG